MASGVPADVLTETINAVSEVIRGNHGNQEYFASVLAPSNPPRSLFLSPFSMNRFLNVCWLLQASDCGAVDVNGEREATIRSPLCCSLLLPILPLQK
jgi:hypothetical protein